MEWLTQLPRQEGSGVHDTEKNVNNNIWLSPSGYLPNYHISEVYFRCTTKLNNLQVTSQTKTVFCPKALYYSCTLVPPRPAATSPTHCCEMWLPRQCHLPIVTSQWVFTVISLDHWPSNHFINGEVTSALAKQHFVHCKFVPNCRLLIFNSDIICFLNTFCVNWHFHLCKSLKSKYQTWSLW